MVKLSIKSLDTNLTDDEIVSIGKKVSSDFVFFAQNFNHFYIVHNTNEDVIVKMKNGDKYELETSINVREIGYYIEILEMYFEYEDGNLSRDYLPFILTSSRQ